MYATHFRPQPSFEGLPARPVATPCPLPPVPPAKPRPRAPVRPVWELPIFGPARVVATWGIELGRRLFGGGK
jgi:hypothetical protein